MRLRWWRARMPRYVLYVCMHTYMYMYIQMYIPIPTQAAEMMMKLTAVNRWCVTGTPVQRCLLGMLCS